MRLLNVHTLQLEEKVGVIPPYTILSHTWGNAGEDVTFSDISSGQAQMRKGYAKVENACYQSARRYINYCWIDSCCIDKNSSSELSEAINSMFEWYQSSQICFAFLEDVSVFSYQADLPGAKWFTRGWTLQELLAPARIEFFDKDWKFLGANLTLSEVSDKQAFDFMKIISSITNIDLVTLRTPMTFRFKSIATRMSWASKRTTTRVEDIAYCLLGIFQVKMPLLYGEGRTAFLRLQEEIIKSSNDHSIFIWGIDERIQRDDWFASLPIDFENSGKVVPFGSGHSTLPYAITNRGIQIQLPVMKALDNSFKSVALLDCQLEGDFSCRFAVKFAKDAENSAYTLTSPPFLVQYEDTLNAELRTFHLPTSKQYRTLPLFGTHELTFWVRFYSEHQTDCALESFAWKGTETSSLNRDTNTAKFRWDPTPFEKPAEIMSLLLTHKKSGNRFVILIECNIRESPSLDGKYTFTLIGMDLLYASEWPFKQWYEEYIIKRQYRCTNREIWQPMLEFTSEHPSDKYLVVSPVEPYSIKAALEVDWHSSGENSPVIVAEVSRELRFGHKLCIVDISFPSFG